MRIQSSIPNLFKFFIYEKKILPVKYKKFGYKSENLLINGGILFTVLFFNVLALTVAIFFYFIPYFRIKFMRIINWIVFESMIKFWLQSFFELGIAGFVMVKFSEYFWNVLLILDFFVLFCLIVRFI